MASLPRPQVRTSYWPLQGGLDTMTPNYTIDPGKLRQCRNYEPRLEGGYRRISGYIKWDSDPVPGTGPILGVWYYDGRVYAFRNTGDAALQVSLNVAPSTVYTSDGFLGEQTKRWWWAAAYGGTPNPTFCIVAGLQDNTTKLSDNGIDWTYSSITAGSYFWSDIAWNGSVFCAVDQNLSSVATSADGLSWNIVLVAPPPDYAIVGSMLVVAANDSGDFCVIGDHWPGAPSSTSVFTLVSSDNGATWTRGQITIEPYHQYMDIAWNGSVYCVIDEGRQVIPPYSNSNKAATSADGFTWTVHDLPRTAWWIAITSDGNNFCAITKTGYVALSSDGENWTEYELPEAGNGIYSWIDVTWNGSVFCALSLLSGYVAYSSDGTDWTLSQITGDNVIGSWKAITANPDDGTIVAIKTNSNYVAVSMDNGETWTLVTQARITNGLLSVEPSLCLTTAGTPNLVESGAVCMWSSVGSGWRLDKPNLPYLEGAKYELLTYNFDGTPKMYGAYPGHKAFQWDGTTWTDLTTGMSEDKPRHIAAHMKSLFLSFGTSLQFSATGDPTDWSVVTGAGEIATSDTITGLIPAPGGVLVVLCKKNTMILGGTSADDFLLTDYKEFGVSIGAIEWTIQGVGSHVHYLDNRGIVDLSPTVILSNFEESILTYPVQDIIAELKTQATASVVIKDKSQYRIYFGNRFLIFAFSGQAGVHQLVGIGDGYYPIPVEVTCRSDDTDGDEIVLFGSDGTDGGYIYRMERGDKFDETAIQAWLVLAFNNFKSPFMNKRYLKAIFDINPLDSTGTNLTVSASTVAITAQDITLSQLSNFLVVATSISLIAAPAITLTQSTNTLSIDTSIAQTQADEIVIVQFLVMIVDDSVMQSISNDIYTFFDGDLVVPGTIVTTSESGARLHTNLVVEETTVTPQAEDVIATNPADTEITLVVGDSLSETLTEGAITIVLVISATVMTAVADGPIIGLEGVNLVIDPVVVNAAAPFVHLITPDLMVSPLYGYNNSERYAITDSGETLSLSSSIEGILNTIKFSNFYFPIAVELEGEIGLYGTAPNLSFLLYSNSSLVHDINGVTVNYSPRNLRR